MASGRSIPGRRSIYNIGAGKLTKYDRSVLINPLKSHLAMHELVEKFGPKTAARVAEDVQRSACMTAGQLDKALKEKINLIERAGGPRVFFKSRRAEERQEALKNRVNQENLFKGAKMVLGEKGARLFIREGFGKAYQPADPSGVAKQINAVIDYSFGGNKKAFIEDMKRIAAGK